MLVGIKPSSQTSSDLRPAAPELKFKIKVMILIDSSYALAKT